MSCDSPLKGYRDRHTGGITFRRENGIEKMEVACGVCLGCRLDHRNMWAMRIAHEASLHEYNGGNSFLTLTYRDARACESYEQYKEGYYVPNDWSLHPEHVTLFIKRLRKFFGDQHIRYFYCGEYGKKCQHGIDLESVKCPLCNVGRPHYHMCLFNGSFTDLVAYESDGGITRYTSPTVEKLWKYGFVDVGELNYASANYAGKYLLKKQTGDRAHTWYCQYDLDGVVTYLQPEFCRMSRGNASGKGRKCGIGADWFEAFHSDCFPADEVPVYGVGVVKKVPRYYQEIYAERNPEEMEKIRAARKKYMRENAEEYTPKRLEDKHICKKARIELFQKSML